MKKQINYEYINELYMAWLNERDPFMQRKRKEEVKNKISPYELLMYSIRYSLPFKAFRNIFPLSYLFKTLNEMRNQGIDITSITNQALAIEGIEDIQALNEFSREGDSSEIRNFKLKFEGSAIFKYGNVKMIGEKFPYACVNYFDLELVEEMIKYSDDYKGIPIIITIDNMGQLPSQKLNEIEEKFDVAGIRIIEKDRKNHTHQGEQRPLNLNTYKQIRGVIDNEIINKLYVNENANKVQEDYQLAIQIIDKIISIIEFDYEAAKEEHLRFSNEVVNASGVIGLLTRKSICKGYSEIARNVFSCVGIESRVVDGTYAGGSHSWNQIKLGDDWFNADITTARSKIHEGEPSGNLFMSDNAFFGDIREWTFEKGVELKGKSMESTVIIGGHSKAYGTNNKECKAYITPVLTSNLIQDSRLYAETYNKDGKSPDYKGVVPYIGSNVEKMRSNSMAFVGSGR